MKELTNEKVKKINEKIKKLKNKKRKSDQTDV